MDGLSNCLCYGNRDAGPRTTAQHIFDAARWQAARALKIRDTFEPLPKRGLDVLWMRGSPHG